MKNLPIILISNDKTTKIEVIMYKVDISSFFDVISSSYNISIDSQITSSKRPSELSFHCNN